MNKPGKCPYCQAPIPDKEHIVEIVSFHGNMCVIIGCPKHPRGGRITAMNVEKPDKEPP